MKIDGRKIAKEISLNLEKDIDRLINRGIVPHLAIIQVGNDPASKSYIRQKIKKASDIGVRITYKKFPKTVTEKTLLEYIQSLNNDASVHGIIIQRPVPIDISNEVLNSAVLPIKDVDGFHRDSTFEPPLAKAVLHILEVIASKDTSMDLSDFTKWLTSRNIVFIGRGEAGGKPVIRTVEKLGIKHSIVHSRTDNKEELLRTADIIVSAVGKKDVIRAEHIQKGVILIGIGLHKEGDNKLYGDYNEDEVAKKATYYTPTPGGVGPVNVTMLFANVVKAALLQNPL